jgi:hypothetical protein
MYICQIVLTNIKLFEYCFECFEITLNIALKEYIRAMFAFVILREFIENWDVYICQIVLTNIKLLEYCRLQSLKFGSVSKG